MNTRELYEDLTSRGVKLSIQGDLLVFSASKGTMTQEMLGTLRKHKLGLIELIKAEMKSNEVAVKLHPASFGQEALWLIHQGRPRSASYHAAAALRILSPVNIPALNAALNKLIVRHDSLRTMFTQVDSELQCRVKSFEQADFKVIDAAALSDEAVHAEVEAEYAAPFDLEAGPLFRTRLFVQSPERSVLLLTLHHIIFDATSLWILQSELQALYTAEINGDTALLPASTASFSNFVEWQRELLASEAGKEQAAYWDKALQGKPVPGELPWSFPRPQNGDRNAASFCCAMEESLGVGLRQLSKSLAATPFAVSMALFQLVVHRTSGQSDFVVGTTTNGRTQPQFENGIGYFVNVLPIRGSFVEGMKFSDLVSQVKERMFGALEASDLPFPLIVKQLNPVRTANAAPLCRVVFGLQKPHAFAEISALMSGNAPAIKWGSLVAQAYPLRQQEGQFDLTMELYEGTDSFNCVLKYDRNLLSDEAAKRFTSHYFNLLRAVIDNPYSDLSSYPLTSLEEQQQLLQWSRGDAIDHLSVNACSSSEDALPDTLVTLWKKSVERYGDSISLHFRSETWTYTDLDKWSDSVASYFMNAGIKPGMPLLFGFPRSPLSAVCLLAAAKCGAVYVPIASDSPQSRITKIVNECKPHLVVTHRDPSQFEIGPKEVIRIVSPDTLAEGAFDAPCDALSDQAASQPSETSAAYIIYTSGSSGIPKGVEVSHQAIAQHARAMADVYAMKSTDRVLQFCDLTFDPSLEQFFTAWSCGAAVIMRCETMYTGDGFWREVEDKSITVANLPPSFFTECSDYIGETHHLRLVIVGGDAFPVASLEKWKSSGIRLLNAYGPTEAVVTATVHEVADHSALQVPIGRPKPGSRAYVIASNGHLAPIGTHGELVLGGPMLATRYFDEACAENQRFEMLNITEHAPERVYRTGDLARWNDKGNIEFLGRLDRQIKIRGYRVEPGEVEAALLRFPGVSSAVVRLDSDDQHSFLAGYLRTQNNAEPSRAELFSHLKQLLPSYMVPERFAVVETWPLNAAGKVDFSKLPFIPRIDETVERNHTPPRNALERAIASVWSEVLEVDQVGIYDDFYELGGGSLQSLRIISRLRQKGVSLHDTNAEMSPHLLFQYVTISELSSHLQLSHPSVDSLSNVS